MSGLKNLIEKNEEFVDVITTAYSDSINLSGLKTVSVQSIVDIDVPAADNIESVDTDEDTATITGHDLTTGLKIQLTTTGTLPTGLSTSTDYFIIVVDEDTVQFSDTLAHALAGTGAINITGAGSGTHTVTAVALAGCTIEYQKSNDNVHFDAIAAATAITVDVNLWFEKDEPTYKFLRLKYTLTAGRLSSANHVYAEGNE